MAYYAASATRPERAKAIAAVAAVHALLALIILSGLNVHTVGQAVERLTTINVEDLPPPPPKPPPPAPKPQQMKKAAGAPAKRAEASPVVAPPPKLPVPSPIPAARIAGTGSATSSGASTSGTGTGAGGAGNGPGGGYGDFSRFTPARIIRRIPNSEYRRISGGRMPWGSAAITFRVTPQGTMAACRVVRSSGDPYVDSNVCEAATRDMSFAPARDPSGRPVAQDMTYVPSWHP